MVEFLKRLDNEEVHRKPDWAAPVRVAAEQAAGRFSRFIFQAVFHVTDAQRVRMVLVILRHCADSVGRQKLVLIQHVSQHAAKLVAIEDRYQAAFTHTGCEHARLAFGVAGTIRDEPVHAALEGRQAPQKLRFESVDSVERNQSDHRACLHGNLAHVRNVQHVVEESVLVVPETDAVFAAIIHGVGDLCKVLPELAGNVFVSRILVCQLEGHGQHVEAIHRHPACPIGLFDVAARRQRRAAIEDADVVESQKSALKDVLTFGVLAIHPPCEVQHELVEHALEEFKISPSPALLLDLVDAPRSPRVNRRIHVPERPLVRWNLTVGMHVPFAQQQD